MPNNSTASIHSTPAPAWQTLAEFTLPSQPGYDRQARTCVAEAVRQLDLPVAHLERLKTAVAEATLYAIEHSAQYRSDLPVVIRVLISDKTLPTQIIGQGNGSSISSPETPDLAAGLANQQASRGWGFFLIKRMRDDLRIIGAEAHHTIELFLYLEGGKPNS